MWRESIFLLRNYCFSLFCLSSSFCFYVIDLASIPDKTFKKRGNFRKSKHNKYSLFFLTTIHMIYYRIRKAYYNGNFFFYLFIYIVIIQISGSNKSTFFNLQSFSTKPQFFIWSNWNNLCVLCSHRNIKKKDYIKVQAKLHNPVGKECRCRKLEHDLDKMCKCFHVLLF